MISEKSLSFENSRVLKGLFCVVAAQFFFTTQDMMIKWLSSDYALHQIILSRAVVGTLFILLVFVPMEGGISVLRTRRLGMHLMRGFGIVIANLAFFSSLISIKLGEATAIFFIAPVLITALSVVLLGEKVGHFRWIAVSVGLIGVLIMIRPRGEIFNAASLLPLVAALAYALVHIMTRKMSQTEQASAMAFYIQMNFVVVSFLIGLFFGDGKFADPASPTLDFLFRAWLFPSLQNMLMMFAIGLFSGLGAYFISQAYRICEAGAVAPFEYSAMPLAIFWGIIIFGEWPDLVSWFGILFIAGAGLLILFQESNRGREIASDRPMPRNR